MGSNRGAYAAWEQFKKFPLKTMADIAKEPLKDRDKVLDIITYAVQLHEEYQRLLAKNIELENELRVCNNTCKMYMTGEM